MDAYYEQIWANWISPNFLASPLLDCIRSSSSSPPKGTFQSRNGTWIGVFERRSIHSIGALIFGLIDFLCEADRSGTRAERTIVLCGWGALAGQLATRLERALQILERIGIGPAKLVCIDACPVDDDEMAKSKIVRIERAEDWLWGQLEHLEPEALYLAGAYRPSRPLRRSRVPLLGPLGNGPWREPLCPCPSGAKRPPAGKCFRAYIRFTLGVQDDLSCACQAGHTQLEGIISDLLQLLSEMIDSCSPPDRQEPKLRAVEHKTRNIVRQRAYAVMLPGSPSVSLGSMALAALAAKLTGEHGCSGLPLLIVEDELTAACYKSYAPDCVREMYRELANMLSMEIHFSSELPCFGNNFQNFLKATTLEGLMRSLPSNTLHRVRGSYTAYDAIHLASMAACWAGSEDYSMVVRASNVASLGAITLRLPPSYVSCHELTDYHIRAKSAAEVRRLKQLIDVAIASQQWLRTTEDASMPNLSTRDA